MKQGGRPETNSGFTIIETLIVLAVTGLLFASAVLLINGRQNRTEFMTGINDLKQQIQQIINETASGYYPGGNFTCTKGVQFPTLTAGTDSQGSNSDCIFLGKAVRFGDTKIDSTTTTFTVYPLTANRLNGSNQEQLDPAAMAFAAVAPGATINTSAPDNSTVYTTQNGVNFQSMFYQLHGSFSATNNKTKLSLIAFAANSSASYSGNLLQSGSQNLAMYAFSRPTYAWGSVTNSPGLVDGMDGSNLLQLDYISLCFSSGTTNQSGLITVGSPSGGLGVSLKIFNDTVCS